MIIGAPMTGSTILAIGMGGLLFVGCAAFRLCTPPPTIADDAGMSAGAARTTGVANAGDENNPGAIAEPWIAGFVTKAAEGFEVDN